MDMPPEPTDAQAHQETVGGNKAFHNFANEFSHVRDPNLRRRLAFAEIDKVPLGRHNVRAVAVAGIGFFLDSYNIFAINLVLNFLGVVYWHGSPEDPAVPGLADNHGILPSHVNVALKVSTSVGIMIGQLLFGWLADVFGRRKMYGIELMVVLISTLNFAMASPSRAMNSTVLFIFWRVIMGIGIGGDYPLSSVITAEFASTRWRGALMAAVFSLQGVGQLVCAVVALVVTRAFKASFITAQNVNSCDLACQMAADRAWRIIVGFGALPACLAFYYRITIPETPRYTFDVAHDVEKAGADVKAFMSRQAAGEVSPTKQARTMAVAGPSLHVPPASWHDLRSYLSAKRNMRTLIGTALSWFFLDLAFYGLGLNNTIVLEAIGYSHGETFYDTLCDNAVGMIILACAGSLPGYLAAIFAMDTIGRKPLQILGFTVLTLLFCVLGFCYPSLSKNSLLTLYVIAQFFFNLGPNTTTFVVPGECFPTRYRSTGHGISAAMGKLGAIVAQLISIPLLAPCHSNNPDSPNIRCSPYLDRLMQIFALFMLLGTLVSFLIPETKGLTLEELAGEPSTSQISGTNGSDQAVDRNNAAWWKRVRPSLGSQLAAFHIPRWPGRGRVQPRLDILTSSGIAGQQQQQQGTGGSQWWRLGRNRVAATRSSGKDFSLSNDQSPLANAGSLPGWSAGWGLTDGGGRQTSAESILLHDVGSLLK